MLPMWRTLVSLRPMSWQRLRGPCPSLQPVSVPSMALIRYCSWKLTVEKTETDSIFPASKRHESEDILAKTGQPYQINLFSGVEHGFAVRADISKPSVKFAKEAAFTQAVAWFNQYL